MNIKKYIAELIGTFVLVAFGCGSAVAANSIFISMGSPLPIAFTTLLIAFAFGLSIVAMAYSIGNVSGCHINPAVSLAMLIAGKMNVKDFCGYVVAQLIGATVASAFLWLVFGTNESLGQNGYAANSTVGISMAGALMMEIVLTFVFVLVIMGVTSKKEYSSVAGLVIGLSLTLIHIFGIPFTGTSVNPARSFGPAVIVGGDALAQLPVFIIAPLIGGALAALVYKFLMEEKDEVQVDEVKVNAIAHAVAVKLGAVADALDESGEALEEHFQAMREEGTEDAISEKLDAVADVLDESGEALEDNFEAMRKGHEEVVSETEEVAEEVAEEVEEAAEETEEAAEESTEEETEESTEEEASEESKEEAEKEEKKVDYTVKKRSNKYKKHTKKRK